MSATYVSQQSCPRSCPFLNNGCYAEQGMTGIHTKRLNKGKASPLALAKEEHCQILGLAGDKPLRLHVVGDCKTTAAARWVSMAAEVYQSRHEMPVWTYTHAWRDVPREAWGEVSVLASCETEEQAEQAMQAGYAACITLPALPTRGRAWKTWRGHTIIPCPEQTRRSDSCTTCRLCWDDKALRDRRAVIGFGAHGSGRKRVTTALDATLRKEVRDSATY